MEISFKQHQLFISLLTVRRTHLLEDALAQVHQMTNAQLRQPIKVVFLGEEVSKRERCTGRSDDGSFSRVWMRVVLGESCFNCCWNKFSTLMWACSSSTRSLESEKVFRCLCLFFFKKNSF